MDIINNNIQSSFNKENSGVVVKQYPLPPNLEKVLLLRNQINIV